MQRTIVCLCGSTRFKEAFLKAGQEEALAGRIVVTVEIFGHFDGIEHSEGEKAALDELHLRKIDLADEILVINVGRYNRGILRPGDPLRSTAGQANQVFGAAGG